MAHLGSEEIKVDITSCDISYNEQLVIFNFNIPYRVHQDNPQLYSQVLSDIFNFLLAWFPNQLRENGRTERVTYKVSSTYYLRHSVTGELRRWVGSFIVRDGHDRSALSGPLFYNLGSSGAAFKARVQNCTRIDNIIETLTWTDLDTVWVFDHIDTIVVNAQVIVGNRHSLLHRYGLLDVDVARGRHKRHTTLLHPW